MEQKNQIEYETEACPYCFRLRHNKRVCCGEVHFEEAYVMTDGSVVLKSETDHADAS